MIKKEHLSCRCSFEGNVEVIPLSGVVPMDGGALDQLSLKVTWSEAVEIFISDGGVFELQQLIYWYPVKFLEGW